MKTITKLCLTVAGVLFVVGLALNQMGDFLGGRAESVQYYEDCWNTFPWTDGWGPIRVSSSGVHLGGENGIHVDSSGVSVGGEKGIRVGHFSAPEGEKTVRESGALTGITAIEADVDCADIRVQEGEAVSVSLSWNLSRYEMHYQVEDGLLKVEDESWGKGGGENLNIDCKVILTVPQGTHLDRLDLSTDMGDIQVDAGLTAEKAELSTDMGDVTSRGLSADEVSAESDLGEVVLHMPGSREDYTWDVGTSMGEILVDGAKRNGGLGDIVDRGGSGEKSIEAYTSLGNIELHFSQ